MITITGGQVGVGQISSAGAADGQVATADGSGGVAWETYSDATNGLVQGGNSFGALAVVGTNDAYGLALETGGVEGVRLDTSGRVGIGTTSPAQKLDLVGAASPNNFVNLRINGGTSGTSGYLTQVGTGTFLAHNARAESNSGSFTADITGVGAAMVQVDRGFVAFKTAAATLGSPISWVEAMRVDGGLVGIGVTAPTAALHLTASSTARASLRIPAGTAPTAPNAGDVWVAGTVIKFFDGTTTKEIAFV